MGFSHLFVLWRKQQTSVKSESLNTASQPISYLLVNKIRLIKCGQCTMRPPTPTHTGANELLFNSINSS